MQVCHGKQTYGWCCRGIAGRPHYKQQLQSLLKWTKEENKGKTLPHYHWTIDRIPAKLLWFRIFYFLILWISRVGTSKAIVRFYIERCCLYIIVLFDDLILRETSITIKCMNHQTWPEYKCYVICGYIYVWTLNILNRIHRNLCHKS